MSHKLNKIDRFNSKTSLMGVFVQHRTQIVDAL